MIINASAHNIPLADKSIHAVVTSPPYFGLRKYEGARYESAATGYAPTCQCGREDYAQGICLDPFVGSGTTLEVARECGVKAVGLDISHQYLNEQASWRGLQIAKPDFSKMPLFASL